MYLFLFALIPVAMIYYGFSIYSLEGSFNSLKNKLFVCIYGLVSAAVMCTVLGFFVFFPEYTGTNPALRALFRYLRYFFAPALLFVLYFFWSNDLISERKTSFLFFALPFYAVWLPFCVLFSLESPTFFTIFIEPSLVLLMLIVVSADLRRLFDSIGKKDKFIFGILIFVESLIPAAIYSLWYSGLFILIWAVPALLYAALCFLRSGLKASALNIAEKIRS